MPQESINLRKTVNYFSSASNSQTTSNIYNTFEREPCNPRTKRRRLEEGDSEESNNCLNTPVDNSARDELDSLFSKFKEICNLDLPLINQEDHNDLSDGKFRRSHKEEKMGIKEQSAQKK